MSERSDTPESAGVGPGSRSLERAREVLELCRELGFALAGITSAEPSRDGEKFRSWLGAGKNGSMEYLAQHVEVRVDIRELLETAKFEHSADARSVIMVADQYAARNRDGSVSEEWRPGRGRVARYARGRNYHEVMKRRLHDLADELRRRYPGTTFCSFVDTAPVLERELAQRCGLGWAAKNTMLIHPRRGSYLLLGGAVTSMELAPLTPDDEWSRGGVTEHESRGPVPDFCGTCTRCIDACPTRAIGPYEVDASRCISYLTIERRLPIDPAFFGAMADWVAGCDVCQEVCPHNSRRPERSEEFDEIFPAYEPRLGPLNLLAMLDWTDEDRREAFKVSALKRINLAMIKRNAVIALGNEWKKTGDEAIPARLRTLERDGREDAMVRKTAGDVLEWMGRGVAENG